jgi:multiple RNA-binding domain-containing protein 1
MIIILYSIGPVTEVTVPIDRMSRKVKGFALVTFMVPENAAKAYTELDGSVFQGRMMHLLPGKAKKSLEELAEAGKVSFLFFPLELTI